MSDQQDSVITQEMAAQAVASAKRRLPKRVGTVPLPDPYGDFHITAWFNFPWHLRAEIQSGDEARARAAWTQIILDHDLVDFDGEPYPPAGTDEFYEAIPQEIMQVIGKTVFDNIGKLTPTNAAR